MAVRVTSDVEKPKSGNWDDWVPNNRPDISNIDLWDSFNPGWKVDVSDFEIDKWRTELALGWDNIIRTSTYKGTVRGVHSWTPFQRLDQIPTRKTKVWLAKTPGTLLKPFPSVTIPLPDYIAGDRATVLRRFGDPTVTGTDAQFFAIDPLNMKYYEAASFGPSAWPFSVLVAPYRADHVSVWDLSKDWVGQKTGCSASKIPVLPMLPTYEEYESTIDHAIHFVAAGYAKDETVGMATGTDGPIVGHPLRAGERFRLREDVAAQLFLDPALTKHERALVVALRKYGMILTDKTALDVPHAIRQAQDPRIKVELQIRLSDFDVLLQK